MNLSYILVSYKNGPKTNNLSETNQNVIHGQYDIVIFSIFIVVSGIVSTKTGAGQARLLDYVGGNEPGNRLFSYGQMIIIPLFIYIYYLLTTKNIRKL